MQGVTIIASEEVIKNPDWMFILPLVLGCVALIFCIVGIAANNTIIESIISGLVIVLLIGAIGILLVSIAHNPNIHDYTKYYITVSDETPMLEFNEKYEVLKQHGDLWEVKEILEDN